MFSGHSGVGKSTLVNAIEPTLSLKTMAISETHQQGQHTTTFAEMFDLGFKARIIDTPGIKGFGIVDIDPYELDQYFPEMFEIKNNCKFHNCKHLNEPKCAVKSALDTGEIHLIRYDSYISMLGDDGNQYRESKYH